MLDTYIIDRINRERAERSRRESQVPLHIEPPRPLEPERPAEPFPGGAPPERGSTVIDYRV